jgi:hypothetical protein
MTGRRLGLAGGAALAVLLAAQLPAWAGTVEVQGDRLVLTTGSENVVVNTDSGLRQSVRVETQADGCASVAGNGTVTVETSGCDDEVTVYVPRGFAITVNVAGDGNVHLGSELGEVVASITSDGDLYAGHVQGLVLGVHGSGDAVIDSSDTMTRLDSTGSGDVKLKVANGIVSAGLHGSGDLAIGAIHATAAEVTADGSGDVVIGPGSIAALSAKIHGSGDLVVAASVVAADLTATGGGDIRLSKVTGPVSKTASGGSSISTAGFTGMNAMIAKLATLDGDKLSDLSKLAHDGDHGDWSNISQDSDNPLVIHVHHSGGNGGGATHWFTLIILAGIAWVAFGWVQRNGGFATLKARFIVPGTSGAVTSHPGVAAVRDSLSRLEGRLGRVEGYVTSREFDLQQKFRELDKKS